MKRAALLSVAAVVAMLTGCDNTVDTGVDELTGLTCSARVNLSSEQEGISFPPETTRAARAISSDGSQDLIFIAEHLVRPDCCVQLQGAEPPTGDLTTLGFEEIREGSFQLGSYSDVSNSNNEKFWANTSVSGDARYPSEGSVTFTRVGDDWKGELMLQYGHQVITGTFLVQAEPPPACE